MVCDVRVGWGWNFLWGDDRVGWDRMGRRIGNIGVGTHVVRASART